MPQAGDKPISNLTTSTETILKKKPVPPFLSLPNTVLKCTVIMPVGFKSSFMPSNQIFSNDKRQVVFRTHMRCWRVTLYHAEGTAATIGLLLQLVLPPTPAHVSTSPSPSSHTLVLSFLVTWAQYFFCILTGTSSSVGTRKHRALEGRGEQMPLSSSYLPSKELQDRLLRVEPTGPGLG